MSEQTDYNRPILSVDVNDALEAFDSFNKARKLFFWVFLLIPMVLLQVSFWAIHCEWVTTGSSVDQTQMVSESKKTIPVPEPTPISSAHQTPVKDPVEETTTAPEPETEVTDTPEMPAALASQIVTDERLEPGLNMNDCVKIVMKVSNYSLVFASVVYCLILLMGMKLALTGQMGSLTDLTKAFFLSLILVVLIVPWLEAFSRQFSVALFSYKEIITQCRLIKETNDWWDNLLYYGRFIVLWFLALLVLILAHWRSGRAAKRIKRRLTSIITTPISIESLSPRPAQ
ncbi:MAG: hypothetical protein JW860_03760 [Sedimentisphaerales bacterium]|nr:hypothetical protein [Sedimentisphaerales bacterium]